MEFLASVDFVVLLLSASVGVAVVTLPLLLLQPARDSRMRKRVSLYLSPRKKDSEFVSSAKRVDAKKKNMKDKLKSIEEKRKSRGKKGSVRNLILQSGLNLSIKEYWVMSILFGVLCTVFYSVMKGPQFGLPMVFISATVWMPKVLFKVIVAKRQKKFTQHFPDSVDILVRGLKSGLPVGECFKIIARESPAPVGKEFSTINDEVQMGVSLPDAMERAVERVPTPEMKFFAIVLAVQQQTGGNLAEVLGNISGVLRGRATLREKIKALSSEAKASAAIIGSLPPGVALVLKFANPEYIDLLFSTTMGNVVLVGSGLWMLTGILIMKKMTNFKV